MHVQCKYKVQGVRVDFSRPKYNVVHETALTQQKLC